MPHQVPRRPPRRPSGGQGAAANNAVVFACISDARERMRAIAVDPAVRLAEAADETLRAWLREAPPMGRLT